MRTLFNPSEAAANSAFPNGSRPGTMKTTSSAMRLSTVGRSPALLAAIHVSTRLRMARSSCVIALPLSRRSWLGVRPAFRSASEPPALGGTHVLIQEPAGPGFPWSRAGGFDGAGARPPPRHHLAAGRAYSRTRSAALAWRHMTSTGLARHPLSPDPGLTGHDLESADHGRADR